MPPYLLLFAKLISSIARFQDVLEEVLQDEIMDETDNGPIIGASACVQREKSMSTFLKFFDHKLHASRISTEEIKAICAFLVSNVEVMFAPTFVFHFSV